MAIKLSSPVAIPPANVLSFRVVKNNSHKWEFDILSKDSAAKFSTVQRQILRGLSLPPL
jgi:hypothetical protein